MSRDGVTFPLSLTLIEDFAEGVSSVEEYYGSITVLSSISGLITLLPDGSIKGLNGTFSRFLFGYDRTQLLGKVGICHTYVGSKKGLSSLFFILCRYTAILFKG